MATREPSILSYDRRNRNLDSFPADKLVEIGQNFSSEVQLSIAAYLNFCAGISTENPNLIHPIAGHVMLSYLQYALDQQLPRLAHNLFQPINPYQVPSQEFPDESIVHEFSESHSARNASYSRRVFEELSITRVHERGGRGIIKYIGGGMYTYKSGVIAKLKQLADQCSTEQAHLAFYVASRMQEAHIMPRGQANIKATPATPKLMFELACRIKKSEQLRQQLLGTSLIVDEATFLTTDALECAELLASFETMINSGLNLVLVGLDRNHRGQYLPLAEALMTKIQELQTEGDTAAEVKLMHSFFTYQDDAGEIQVNPNANRTIRYTNGFVDAFSLPIVITRGGVVDYACIPADEHPLELMQYYDPELYADWINLPENKSLLNVLEQRI